MDTLSLEDFGPLGPELLCVIDLSKDNALSLARELRQATSPIVLGLDEAGKLPPIDPDDFDAVLTTAPSPPRPWVEVNDRRLARQTDTIRDRVVQAPHAAAIAMRVLRMTQCLTVEQGLQVESLAYSTLQHSAAFRAWLSRRPAAPTAPDTGPELEVWRENDRVTIELARPERRNPMTAKMRDALFEALAAVVDDPSRPGVELRGRGACFSTGGDLAEFGSVTDAAIGHSIRTARSCAALLHRLGARGSAHLHGACVGSGIEIPAAAAHRRGRPDAFFQLPELGMGLIPGAGGMVTMPRAIGRHRTAYMVLSGRRISAPTALEWGLLTELPNT